MTMIGPEMALVRGRTVPRTGMETYAQLEYYGEDPVRVKARTLAAVLARQYADRLDRSSLPSELRRGRRVAGARGPGLWAALKRGLGLAGRRRLASRTMVTVASLGVSGGGGAFPGVAGYGRAIRSDGSAGEARMAAIPVYESDRR